jgi:hypothetical protein
VLYAGLANVVVVTHFAFLAFVAFGGFLAWKWRGVTWLHLAALAAAVVSVTIHYDCPLTNLELALRRRAHAPVYRHGFVDHYLTGRLYPSGYDWLVQAIVVLLVVISYVHLWRTRASVSEAARAPRRASPLRGASPPPR